MTGPSIRIWQADPETLAVSHTEVLATAVKRERLGDWTLLLDDHVLARLTELRAAKLPNETGGVLIGAYDLALAHRLRRGYSPVATRQQGMAHLVYPGQYGAAGSD